MTPTRDLQRLLENPVGFMLQFKEWLQLNGRIAKLIVLNK